VFDVSPFADFGSWKTFNPRQPRGIILTPIKERNALCMVLLPLLESERGGGEEELASWDINR